MAKIVLCDDSNTILLLLAKQLQDAGHTISGKAMDGNEGLRVFLETKPDVILLDVTMPNKDGTECLKDILDHDPNAKVIMVSALKEQSVAKECTEQGAKAFISKENILNKDAFKRDVLSVIERVVNNGA